jgi:hypothetical protein
MSLSTTTNDQKKMNDFFGQDYLFSAAFNAEPTFDYSRPASSMSFSFPAGNLAADIEELLSIVGMPQDNNRRGSGVTLMADEIKQEMTEMTGLNDLNAGLMKDSVAAWLNDAATSVSRGMSLFH